ncbi:MAG: N-acetyltransferase [Clostridia bacterium]|nr:N-acetyltransferase [Clostridia bacterium]
MQAQPGTQTVETARLILRRFTQADGASVLKNWAADARVQSPYAEPVYETPEAVRGLLGRYIAAYEERNAYRWAIVLRERQECIGQIAFFLVDEKNRFAELEYCIGSAFQGRGLATEATRAVMGFGFAHMNLHKVQISHKAGNTASRRVIEKCGFVYEGTLRDYFYEDGRYTDRLFYSVLRSEYEAGVAQL